MNIVDKHKDREFSAIMQSNGVVLCDKEEGAFIVLRSPVDLDRLKKLLDKIQVVK